MFTSQNTHILNQTEAWVITLLLFSLMILSSFVGKLLGNHIRNKKDSEEKSIETSALTALLFFLTGIYIWHEWRSLRFAKKNYY